MATASRHLAAAAGPGSQGEAIRVRGLVQGVGFRPTVWRLARECGLAGDVCNDAAGVLVRAWGSDAARQRFLHRLRAEAPPLSRIDALETEPLDGEAPAANFHITASAGGRVHTWVVADAATCPDCLAEVFDPADRRYRYPFANCTHCGPRLSIVRSIPYDRANTSMVDFALCEACGREYDDPSDRRFHAQPNACPDCGPQVWLEGDSGLETRDSGLGDAIGAAQRLLRAGRIVAIKGIGGFHLAVDAGNPEAVAELRRRKRRGHKPFALMARDRAMIRRYCDLGAEEDELLTSTAAPIVLLEMDGPERLAEAVAPGQRCYGFMLAYSPLHHLLMDGLDAPIVLTSGNASEEPQCIGNDEAREQLAGIADAWLLHDRAIVNRVDDSVLRVIAGAPALLRRARGYAPTPLRLPAGFGEAPPTLALGGELKNTFCLLADGEVIASQHLGDLENPAANAAYRQTLDLYLNLFEHRPQVLAIDAHPEYLPSKLGREWAASQGLSLIEVQHHHAHIAACMADNELDRDAPPVLGIALDGTGYGDDGTLWGGEFLRADYRDYRRLGAFMSVPMPGGEQAIRQPWRMGYAHLRRLEDWQAIAARHAHLPFFQAVADQPLATLEAMIAADFNCPATSACGRLFDAVAAVIGLRQIVSYEGQAAIELEAAIEPAALHDGHAYPFSITDGQGLPGLEPRPMWQALLHDLVGGAPTGVIAARFHAGLAAAVARMAGQLMAEHGHACAGRIALSGGVFQNAALTKALIPQLESSGYTVLRHRQVPANDGGLSLGQAVVAATRTSNEETRPCA